MSVKVLYVEDEPSLGRIVKESLESRNFVVHMVADGVHALPAFRTFAPDICVFDIMLPGVDGYTIAREVRQTAPDIPIIFVTAKVQTQDLIRGFESGGNDYIRKPFSMEELIVRINNLLRLTQTPRSSAKEEIKIGRYEFVPDRYEIRIDGNTRKLSHREATLLQMLVENRNATIPRKDILLKIWGDDSFFNSRNLDVYITRLRDLFKLDKSVQIITIKGVGYHFTDG